MGEYEWTFKRRLLLLLGSTAIAAAVCFIFKYMFFYVWPFILAFGLAVILEPPIIALSRLFKGRKAAAATVVVALVTAILIIAALYLCYIGFRELRIFLQNFDENMASLDRELKDMCCRVDDWINLKSGCAYGFLCRCREMFSDADGDMLADVMRKHSLPAITNCVMLLAGIIVCFIATVYAALGLERYRIGREQSVFGTELCVVHTALKTLLNAYFRVQLIIMAINTSLCIIAFFLTGSPYAVLFGVLTGLIDALPIFGTGTVLIPAILINLLLGNVTDGVVLAVLYIATYFVREIMESKFMGDCMGIAPFTMLAVIYVGILFYGIVGFILGPVSYCIIKALVLHLKCVMENDKL